MQTEFNQDPYISDEASAKFIEEGPVIIKNIDGKY